MASTPTVNQETIEGYKRLHSLLSPDPVETSEQESKTNINQSEKRQKEEYLCCASGPSFADLKDLFSSVLKEKKLDIVSDKIGKIETEMAALKNSIEFSTKSSQEAINTAKLNEKEVQSLRNEVSYLKQELHKQQKRADMLELEQKKKNLKLLGMTESKSRE